MIDSKKFNQYGFKRDLSDVKGICIHNTTNYLDDVEKYIADLNAGKRDLVACHYVVNQNGVSDVLPIDYGVYHTGKLLGYGDRYTICVLICSNLNNDLYLQGQDKAIELIKELMGTYNITKDELYFHIDFNSKFYCPANILNLYGNKKNFLDKFFGGQEWYKHYMTQGVIN